MNMTTHLLLRKLRKEGSHISTPSIRGTDEHMNKFSHYVQIFTVALSLQPNTVKKFLCSFIQAGGPSSSAGIATGYGLGGPGIESR